MQKNLNGAKCFKRTCQKLNPVLSWQNPPMHTIKQNLFFVYSKFARMNMYCRWGNPFCWIYGVCDCMYV